jgi:hypothetical protein
MVHKERGKKVNWSEYCSWHGLEWIRAKFHCSDLLQIGKGHNIDTHQHRVGPHDPGTMHQILKQH